MFTAAHTTNTMFLFHSYAHIVKHKHRKYGVPEIFDSLDTLVNKGDYATHTSIISAIMISIRQQSRVVVFHISHNWNDTIWKIMNLKNYRNICAACD